MPEIKNPMTALVVLQGRICNAPKIADGDKPRANFTIAHDYWEKDRQTGGTVKKSDFFDVVAFGFSCRDAERLTVGENVQVTGTIRVEKWQKDGVEKTSVKVLADTVRSMQWANDSAKPATKTDNLEPQTDGDIPF